MKKHSSLRPALLALFGLGAGLTLPAQTMISGDTIASNLYVTNNVDMNGTAFTQGAVTISSTTDYRLKISDDASAVYFEQRKPTTNGDWLWQYNNGSTTVTTAKLDANSVLSLFSSGTAKVTLSPVGKSITLDTATLTGSGSALTAGGAFTTTGAFTASAGITNTNGTLTGGSSGLRLSAGGTNQSISLSSSGAGDLIFNTNGIERARIKSTGAMGVGTNTPAATLHVKGTTTIARFESTGASALTSFAPAAADEWRIGAGNNSTNDFGIRNVTRSNTVLTIAGGATGGNVGILTTNPLATLDVNGAIRSSGTRAVTLDGGTGMIRGQGDSGGWAFGYHATGSSGTDRGGFGFFGSADSLSYYYVGSAYNNATLVVLPSNGNVGMGLTNPSEKLEVSGAIKSSGSVVGMSRLVLQSTAAGGQQYEWYNDYFGAGSGALGLYNRTANNTSITVTAGGNVGIGATAAAAKLHVQRDGAVATDYSLSQLFVGGTDGNKRLAIAYDTTNNVGLIQAYINGGTTQNLSLQSAGGNVGIGTPSPGAKLHLSENLGNSMAESLRLDNTANTADNGNKITWRNAGQNMEAAYVGGVRIGSSLGYALTFATSPNWVTGGTPAIERMRIDGSGNVGIGTTNTGSYKLAVLGSIHANAVVVETGWSDYVFDQDYRLAPLSEVEAHIKAEKHLPGIPSAAEVAEHGVSLGDMQSKLLAKIEELTLRQIAQEKQLNAQDKQLNSQAARIAQLEQENHVLRTAQP